MGSPRGVRGAWRVLPSTRPADVFAEFDRPVLVLVRPEVGSVCLFGTGGVDGSPWTVDAEYVDQIGSEVNRVALVRTHRPVRSCAVDRVELMTVPGTA